VKKVARKGVNTVKTFQVIRGGIVFELQPEPEGGYTISVPSLPGCISYGKTFEEAIEMIKDAMEGWLAVAREEGVPIPEQFETIQVAAL
jgi:predicted RNase H-like HicB family nuclease